MISPEEQAERKSVIEYLYQVNDICRTNLEPEISRIEHQFIIGEIESKEAADEILKLILSKYRSLGNA